MDTAFSVDELWSAEAEADSGGESKSKSNMMSRCSSEWEFQRFLQESSRSRDDEKPQPQPQPQPQQITPNPNPSQEDYDYQAFLKTRLNLACAAVAFTRASCVKPHDSAVLPENAPQTSNTCQLGSQIPPEGSSCYQSKGQDKDVCGSLGISSLPSLQQKAAVQVKSTTSGSSRDQSDDDELEGETATTQNGDPSDARRVRRMLSNRESARRSRRRKQAHLSELEGQVSQVKVENSSLLKRLTDINNKYSEAAVDNRILKADVETLRAKVKMAEETVKRVTGLNPLFQAMPDISTIGMPSFACSPSDTSIDTAVPVREDDPKHHHLYHHQPTSSNRISHH